MTIAIDVPEHLLERYVAAGVLPEHYEGVTGVIIDAEIAKGPYLQEVAWGLVFGHPGFPQGHYIHTSTIRSGPDENGLIQTDNSIYRLFMKSRDDA
jgi:hypothetical protein